MDEPEAQVVEPPTTTLEELLIKERQVGEMLVEAPGIPGPVPVEAVHLLLELLVMSVATVPRQETEDKESPVPYPVLYRIMLVEAVEEATHQSVLETVMMVEDAVRV